MASGCKTLACKAKLGFVCLARRNKQISVHADQRQKLI